MIIWDDGKILPTENGGDEGFRGVGDVVSHSSTTCMSIADSLIILVSGTRYWRDEDEKRRHLHRLATLALEHGLGFNEDELGDEEERSWVILGVEMSPLVNRLVNTLDPLVLGTFPLLKRIVEGHLLNPASSALPSHPSARCCEMKLW